MRSKQFWCTVVGIGVLAGCQAAPSMSPVGHEAANGESAGSPEYQLLSTAGAVATTSVVASTTKSSYYAVSKVLDGNLTSAWMPLSRDSAPCLTFTLQACTRVTSFGIKVSPTGVMVDVSVYRNGAWRTIATGLKPAANSMVTVEIPDADAEKVKLSFRGVSASNLSVCEVKFYGTSCPVPTPAPTATPMPTPTPKPSATPTPAPPPCGSYQTFTQGGWGSNPAGNNPGMFLKNNWSRMVGSRLVVGTGYTLTFTSPQAVANFLPSGGTPGTLTGSLTNPTGKTSAGVFAAQVVALELNLLKNPGLANVRITSGAFAGLTIGQLHALAERVLGGNPGALPAGTSISSLNDQVTRVNEFFNNGPKSPSGTFACP